VSDGVRLRGVRKGKILAVDSTTLEENAAIKSILPGHSPTQLARWPALGNSLISRLISARSTDALR